MKDNDSRDDKIVVTGTTGLVGSHVVAELLRCGYYRITLPVRNRKRLTVLHQTLSDEGVDTSKAQFHIVETTLNNPLVLSDLFAGASTVFNCAATVALGGVDGDWLVQSNVELTQHIVNASLDAGVDRLIHVSSIAALGTPPEGELYADESTIIESLADASPYARSKFLSENEVMRGGYLGLKTVIVNPSIIIGSGDRHSGSTSMIPLLARGLPIYTEGVTAWVDVLDVARAMVLLSQSDDAIGERFVLVADNLSFRELITIANKATGRRPPFIKAGSRLVGVAQNWNELLASIKGHPPKLTQEIAKSVLSKNYYCGEKIKRYIDFEYTPLEDTIERVIGNYLSHKG